MPVYRHLDSGKRFFFVHIPRTGGRFFERNLYDQHFGAEHDNIWNSIVIAKGGFLNLDAIL